LRWRQANNSVVITSRLSASIAIRRGKIDSSIRAFGHLPYSTVLPLQQVFLTHHFSAVECHSDNPFSTKTAKKEISAELRKGGSSIKQSASWCTCGCVLEQRTL